MMKVKSPFYLAELAELARADFKIAEEFMIVEIFVAPSQSQI